MNTLTILLYGYDLVGLFITLSLNNEIDEISKIFRKNSFKGKIEYSK